jgi:hypothetical protein
LTPAAAGVTLFRRAVTLFCRCVTLLREAVTIFGRFVTLVRLDVTLFCIDGREKAV